MTLVRNIVFALLFVGVWGQAQAQQPTTQTIPNPLVVAITDSYSPFTLVGPSGKPAGLIVEIWKLWSQATGHPVEFRVSGWAQTIEDVKNGKAHIHSGMFENAERSQWFAFSDPIAEIPTALYFLPNIAVKPRWIDDLKGRKVAAMKGSYQETWLKEAQPGIEVVGVPAPDDLVLGLLDGTYDAVLSEVPSIDGSLAKVGMRGAVDRTEQALFTNYVVGAVRKDDTALLAAINDGLAKIPAAKLIDAERRWLGDPGARYFERKLLAPSLSEDEKAWLRDHPILKVAVTTFIEPIDIVDKSGAYSGFNADLMRLLSEQLGVQFVPEFHDRWGDVVASAMEGRVDLALSLSRTPERERNVIFTRPYAYDPAIIVVRNDDRSVHGWADLKGKTVSVVTGASTMDETKVSVGQDGKVIVVEDEATGMALLRDGQVDAHVSWLLQYGNAQRASPVEGLRIAVTKNSESGSLRIGVHKSQPELAGILDKALSMIPRTRMTAAWAKWTNPADGAKEGFRLTAEERIWLQSHSTVTVGMMNAWPPLSFENFSGAPAGVSADLLAALNKRLGGVLVSKPAPFKENYQAVLDGKLEAIFDITPRPDRMDLFNFTAPYLTIPHAVIARDDTPYIADETALADKVVALEQGFGNVKKLKAAYPGITIKEYKNTEAALDAVSRGEADAYVGNRAVATYIIEQQLMHNLKVHGRATFNPVVLALGTRKDNTILAGILEKALADISSAEQRAILSRWVFTAPKPESTSLLTPEEQKYVDANPTFSIAATPDWPPFEFKDGKGQYQGITADFIRLAASKVGLRPVPVLEPWADLLDKLRSGEIDVAPGLFKTPEREKFLTYGDPVVEVYDVIYTRSGRTDIGKPEDLAGKKIAVEQGYSNQEILARDIPSARLVVVNSSIDALQTVVTGQADAYVGNQIVANYLIKKHLIQDIEIAGFYSDVENPLYFATNKNLPQLHAILAKGFAAITDDERSKILDKWVGSVAKPDVAAVQLTPEEQAWLRKHPVLRVQNEKDWVPFNFFEGGRPRGFSIDFMTLVAEKIGVRVDYVTGPTWPEFMTMLKQHQIDVILNMVKTPEREKFTLFTEPYAENPPFVFARQGHTIKTFGDLVGRTVCVPSTFFYEELLRSQYPDINLRKADDQLACLRMVSSGSMDATIGGAPEHNYLIRKNFLTNVVIAVAIDDPRFQNELRLGVRNDWPILQNILTKAVAAVTEEERVKITQRWIAAGFTDVSNGNGAPQGEDLGDLLIQLAVVVVGFLVVIVLLFSLYRYAARKAGAKLYESRTLAVGGVVLVTLFLGGVMFATWMVLVEFESATRQRTAASLKTILEGTHQALVAWTDTERKLVNTLLSEQRLRTAAAELLVLPVRDKARLMSSPQQDVIRAFFDEHFAGNRSVAYGVLNLQGEVFASSNMGDIGGTSAISSLYAETLVQAMSGKTVFIPPTGEKGLGNTSGIPLVYFAAPVFGAFGQPLGVVVVGYPMSEAYNMIVNSGRLLDTGETYVFDKYGRMLSESRFTNELRRLGLIKDGQSSVVNLRVTDPGVNLRTMPDKGTEIGTRPLTRMADDAIAGNNGLMVSGDGYRDYRGVPVFGAWLWNADLNIGMATEVDAEEAMGEFYRIRAIILSLVGGAVFVALSLTALSVVMGRRATKELEGLVAEKTAELSESEARANLILTSIGEGLFGTDADGRVTFINPAACDMLGFTPDELAGHRIHAIIHHTHADGAHYPVGECPMYHAYTKGTDARVDGEVLWRKDGTSFPVEYSATPMYRGEELVGSVISFRDVTARVEAEKKVRDREARLHAIMENTADGIITIDESGQIESVNKAVRAIFGYTGGELAGAHVSKLMPKRFADEHQGYIDRYVAGGEPHVVGLGEREVVGLRSDGTEFPLELSIGEAFVGGRRLFVGGVRDITERKEAERKIRESEEKLRFSLVSMEAYLWVDDLKTGTAEYSSPDFYTRLGYGEDEIPHTIKDYLSYIHEDDIAPTMEAVTAHQRGETEIYESEFRFKAKDGRWVWIFNRGKVIERDEKGEMVKLAGISMDNTERKTAQEALESAYAVISDSIEYASRIQRAVLPTPQVMSSVLDDHFVVWQPRDVIGGDIYWGGIWGDGALVALADCTGHGVPGAFITLITMAALDRAMTEVPPGEVGELLTRVHQIVQLTLSQHGEGGQSDDGLELGLCYITPDMTMMKFAGARFSLFFTDGDEVIEVKGTKKGLGYRGIPMDQFFAVEEVMVQPGRAFYMTTDGLIDQVGGSPRRTFGKKRFKNVLLSVHDKPFAEQKEALLQTLQDYQGEETRRDDVSLIGFKL